MFRMRDTGKLDARACRFAVLSGLAAGVMELGSSIFLDYEYKAAWIVQAGYCLPVAVVFLIVAHKSLRANTRFAPYKRFP